MLRRFASPWRVCVLLNEKEIGAATPKKISAFEASIDDAIGVLSSLKALECDLERAAAVCGSESLCRSG